MDAPNHTANGDHFSCEILLNSGGWGQGDKEDKEDKGDKADSFVHRSVLTYPCVHNLPFALSPSPSLPLTPSLPIPWVFASSVFCGFSLQLRISLASQFPPHPCGLNLQTNYCVSFFQEVSGLEVILKSKDKKCPQIETAESKML